MLLYIAIAVLPSVMAISYMEIMLMLILSLQTHGEIYLPDCFSIVKVVQTMCASPERLFSEELG